MGLSLFNPLNDGITIYCASDNVNVMLNDVLNFENLKFDNKNNNTHIIAHICELHT